ncbi:hypothetical protein JXB37_08645, partial [candidate division WOR-3 bacterium]|nr:hypothetical protein [candidate division WOR-3 bacterium]
MSLAAGRSEERRGLAEPALRSSIYRSGREVAIQEVEMQRLTRLVLVLACAAGLAQARRWVPL